MVLVYAPHFTAAQVLQMYGLSLDYLSADTHPIVPRQAREPFMLSNGKEVELLRVNRSCVTWVRAGRLQRSFSCPLKDHMTYRTCSQSDCQIGVTFM